MKFLFLLCAMLMLAACGTKKDEYQERQFEAQEEYTEDVQDAEEEREEEYKEAEEEYIESQKEEAKDYVDESEKSEVKKDEDLIDVTE